jgi:hypothetical protein
VLAACIGLQAQAEPLQPAPSHATSAR